MGYTKNPTWVAWPATTTLVTADALNHIEDGLEAAAAVADTANAGLAGKADSTHTHPSTQVTDFTEAVQDVVGALLAAGTNVTLNYDDAGNVLTITAASGGGSTDPEVVRDTIGVALAGVGNITVTVNDAADTITISTAATVNSTDAALRDRSTHTGTQTASTISDFASAADARVELARGQYVGINAQTGTSYTPVLTDRGKLVTLNNAGAITVTLPQNTDLAFPVGGSIDFLILGAGQATFAAGTGATKLPTGTLTSRQTGAFVTVVKTGTNSWAVGGDLA